MCTYLTLVGLTLAAMACRDGFANGLVFATATAGAVGLVGTAPEVLKSNG